MKHSFQEKLEFSLGARQTFDLELLKNNIVGCVSVVKTDAEADRAGIDYVATLRQGAQILIDAKARAAGASRYWKYGEPELALEVWSICPTAGKPGKVGWTLSESSNADMILFTFEDAKVFYLLPFQPLRMAFQKNYSSWLRTYGSRKERSTRWTSEAVFVPASVVMDEIRRQMRGMS